MGPKYCKRLCLTPNPIIFISTPLRWYPGLYLKINSISKGTHIPNCKAVAGTPSNGNWLLIPPGDLIVVLISGKIPLLRYCN